MTLDVSSVRTSIGPTLGHRRRRDRDCRECVLNMQRPSEASRHNSVLCPYRATGEYAPSEQRLSSNIEPCRHFNWS